MSAQDANAVPVMDDATGQVRPMHTMHMAGARPTFHVSREMVCFIAGIGVTLGIMWLCSQMGTKKRE